MVRSPTHHPSTAKPLPPKLAKTGKDGDTFPLAGVVRARNLYQIKSWKGRPYASRYPSLSNVNPTALQRAWVDHFSCVAWISKIPDPRTFDLAKKLTKDTGWYYRDVIASGAVGKLYQVEGVSRITTPTVMLHRTAGEALSAGVAKVLTPNVMDWDNNRFWNASSNPSRITIRAGGLYLLGAQGLFSTATSNYRILNIRLNGTTNISDSMQVLNGNFQVWQQNQSIWYFNPNDYIELLATSGAAGVSCTINHFWMVGITAEVIQH